MTFAQLSDSHLADKAPELVVILLLVGAVFAGVWRLIGKLQEGQERVVDKFLVHIDKTEVQRLEAEKAQQEVLERVQQSLDRNTLMLGKTGSALERASHVIDRLEHQLEKKQGGQ